MGGLPPQQWRQRGRRASEPASWPSARRSSSSRGAFQREGLKQALERNGIVGGLFDEVWPSQSVRNAGGHPTLGRMRILTLDTVPVQTWPYPSAAPRGGAQVLNVDGRAVLLQRAG